MKRKLLLNLLFVFLLTNLSSFAQEDHVQPAHQQIVREAWNLLKLYNPGYNYVEMNNWVGTNGTSGPWAFDNQRVVAGAHREDEEDVVYNYVCWFTPTNTHFWNVSNPNNPNQNPTILSECTLANCEPPGNAWNKLDNYINGGWELERVYPGEPCGDETRYDVTFQRWDGQGAYTLRGCGHIVFKYEGLVEGPRNLYNTGFMKIVAASDQNGGLFHFNPPLEIKLTGSEKYFVYEILGRMAHLIGDMSVPAHTHNDAHPFVWQLCEHEDSYETKMASYFQNYTAQNCGGNFENPFNQSQYHPVYYLAFLQNQITKWFPSNDASGSAGHNIYPFWPNGYLFGAPSLTTGIFSGYGASGITQANFETIANYCMKSSIRITAGLFYWFLVRTGQVPPPPLGPVTVTANLPVQSTAWRLDKTVTGWLTAHSNNATSFQWEYYLCGNGISQPWPLNQYGLSTLTQSGVNPMGLYNSAFNGANCPLSYGNSFWIRVRAKAFGPEGQTSYSNYYTIYPTSVIPNGGGCPWILVNTDSGSYSDNNILHRSEFLGNVNTNIKDLYKLQITPNIDSNNHMLLQLLETEHDYSYFDNIKLYSVDHPIGTKIVITESNQIAMYNDNSVTSTDDATLNNNNVTPYIQYNFIGKKEVRGSTNDVLYAHYDSSMQMKSIELIKKIKEYDKDGGTTTDSLALIGNIGNNPDRIIVGTPKVCAGIANIYLMDNSFYSKPFSRRELSSEIAIPFEGINDSYVDHIEVDFDNDYSIAYFSVTPITYSGFTVSELTLASAEHSNIGNVIQMLEGVDNFYAELDTTSTIYLKFNNSLTPGLNILRDYVIEVNGHYTDGSSQLVNNILALRNHNESPTSYKLYNNYPNPFNPKTSIKYSLGQASQVNISIYNITGQLVATLVNGFEDAGIHELIFDGGNYASGVYFYKLETTNFIETKKMVLIK